MGEAKFTPGPWIAHCDERSEEWSARLPRVKGAAGQIFMCEVAGPWDRMEANAHLIAAAPELYDALKVFAAEPLSTEPGHNCTKLFSFEDLDEKIRLARAAIAKAEGRG